MDGRTDGYNRDCVRYQYLCFNIFFFLHPVYLFEHIYVRFYTGTIIVRLIILTKMTSLLSLSIVTYPLDSR